MTKKFDFAQKKGFFITATDTEVGKTLFTGHLARLLSDNGDKVGVFKPLASGCRTTREGLVNSDAEYLKMCSRNPLPLSVINPVSYVTPAATILCEERERRPVDYDLIKESYDNIADQSDLVLVEGIGGIRVPLSHGVDVLDMAESFDLPIIIVARPNLGTINHTLLTVDAIRNRGLKLSGVVISGYDASRADVVIETAPQIISQQGGVDILSILPYDASADSEGTYISQTILETLAMTDWHALM